MPGHCKHKHHLNCMRACWWRIVWFYKTGQSQHGTPVQHCLNAGAALELMAINATAPGHRLAFTRPLFTLSGGGSRVVVSDAAFHARVRGSVPGLGGLKETKNVSSPSTCESQYCGEPPWPRGSVLGLRPFESCVWRTVSSQSSHHPQEVLLAQFSLYVHKVDLKPDSFHLFTLSMRA